MNVEFSYDLQKDIENYKRASMSVNNKKPTEMEASYIRECGERFEDQKLKDFITIYVAEQGLDLKKEAKRIKKEWRVIEREFLKRVERIFGVVSSGEAIQAFLTTDTRCSYNIERGYFFVSVSSSAPSQNPTIMHELFHFFTWWVFHEELERGRITKQCYNDVKESLTELLNAEFQDLLEGQHDDGYPQHRKMRAVVSATWKKTKNIQQVFEAATRLCLNR